MKRKHLLTCIIALLLTSCSNDKNLLNPDEMLDMSFNIANSDLVLEDENLSKSAIDIKINNVINNEVELEASNDNIEIINNEVIAKKQGRSTITATYKDISKTIDIEVFNKEAYTSIFDESIINYYGRIDKYSDATGEYVMLDNTASGLDFNFLGSNVSITLMIEGRGFGGLKAVVDGNENAITINTSTKNVVIASGLENKVHIVKITKMVEQSVQRVKLSGIRFNGTFLNKSDKPERKFEFYGDSITCGYGSYSIKNQFTNDTDGSNTYATMLGEHYNAEISCLSHSGIATAFRRDYGNFLMKEVFDQISIFNTKKYDFSKYQADIVFVNLGTNDSAFPDVYNEEEMTSKYLDLITSIREKQPNAYIFCMYGMMGKALTVEEDIRRAVSEFKRTIDTNICYNYIPANIFGTGSHPDESGHVEAYEKIVEIIDSNNLLN